MARGRRGRDLGVILRRQDYRESSRIVQLFTREHGMLSFLAKGAHRRRSRFLGAVDLLHVVDVRIRVKPNRGLQNVDDIRVLQDNRAFVEDSRRRAHAYHLADLVRIAVPEGRQDAEIFDLLRGSLTLYARAARASLATIDVGVKLRLLDLLGFLPPLDRCPESGARLGPRGEVAFVPEKGGFVDATLGARRVSARVPALAARLLGLEGRQLGQELADAWVLGLLAPLVEELLLWHLDARPRVAPPVAPLAAART